MGRKSRELLREILGEEGFERFENGDGIEVKSPDDYIYKIEKRRGYADVVRSRPRSSYSYGSTDSGRIRAFDIDDGIATFIEHARLGKVNWACGNIDIDLPSNMPPRNTSFLTFMIRGLKTIIYYLRTLPSRYVEALRGDDPVIAFLVCVILPWMIVVGAMAFNEASLFGPFIDGLILLFPFYMGIGMGYTRWKRQWEVKLG